MSKGLVYHKDGSFTRPDTDYRSFISREPGAEFPPEVGRYALYISPGCPWVSSAHLPVACGGALHLQQHRLIAP